MRSTEKIRCCSPAVYARPLVLILALASLAICQDIGASATQPADLPLSNEVFRTERMPVKGGSEIVTIFARKSGPDGDLPLISVLRDTLGDGRTENDRLRYVWLHSYTRPSLKQKLASYIPFLYTRAGNNTDIGKSPPPAIIDLNRPSGSGGWDTMFWQVFRRVLLADAGHIVKSGALQ